MSRNGSVPHWPLEAWSEVEASGPGRHGPSLTAGITRRGSEGVGFDLRLIGATATGGVERWLALQRWSGFPTVVHAPQVHGTSVLRHRGPAAGWLITEPADGHVTAASGVLLTVSVADCVPVYLFDPQARVIGILHAGRKGVARQILAEGVAAMVASGAKIDRLLVHAGPSICGRCYEVGPEVHGELGLEVPPGPRPVDLPRLLGEQAQSLGIPSDRYTSSALCTRCSAAADLYSHRAGHPGRQVAFIGLGGAGTPAKLPT